MTVTLRLTLHKGKILRQAQFQIPPTDRATERSGYFATTAHGHDLYQNARSAIRQMIEHLEEAYGLSSNEAYVLCSVAVDLRISQIVNEPAWLVSAYLPLSVFGP